MQFFRKFTYKDISSEYEYPIKQIDLIPQDLKFNLVFTLSKAKEPDVLITLSNIFSELLISPTMQSSETQIKITSLQTNEIFNVLKLLKKDEIISNLLLENAKKHLKPSERLRGRLPLMPGYPHR